MDDSVKYNDVTIYHSSNGKFGGDSIHIFIENTSNGALKIFNRDLQELISKNEADGSDHPVSLAYIDMLRKMSVEMDKMLRKSDGN